MNKEIKELNKNGNKTYPNLWDTMKKVHSTKCLYKKNWRDGILVI